MVAVESAQFAELWEQTRVVLAEHEAWYRKVRVSRSGAPDIRQEVELVEPVICEAIGLYVEGSEAQRTSLRDFFGATDRCLLHLNLQIQRLSLEFERAPSRLGLARALAAMSLENNRLDYRDTYVLLGRMYLTAVRSGLDPKHLLQRTAGISDQQSVYAGTAQESMQGFLAGFTDSAYFRESVEPELRSLLRDS
jgi:hypothetical protein